MSFCIRPRSEYPKWMASTSSSTMTDNNRSFIYEQFQVLRDKVDLLFQCDEPLRKKQRKAKSSVADQINLIEKLLKEELLHLPDAPLKACGTKRLRGVDAMSKELSSRMNEDGAKLPKKLLISNGSVICLLDLEQSKNELLRNADSVLPLPKIATLKLIENGLPVSVGLFKLGSAGYMIGGHDFPPDWKCVPAYSHDGCGGYSLYLTYCSDTLVKGTSRTAYRLSLANDGTLTPSKGEIKKLKSPKFWPIVEEIDGQIHVFDSGPWVFLKPDRDWIFSHEVLERDGRRWSKIPTTGAPLKRFITSHAVLSNRIYAVAGRNFLVFDAEKKEWEAHDSGRDPQEINPFFAKQVWEILVDGIARCAGKFPLISSEPLYVLIAVVRSPELQRDDDDETIYDDVVYTDAVAYLVTSMGQVVCSQPLHDFFEGPMQPCRMKSGTMIKADKEGKTMCTILSANSFVDGKEEDRNVRDLLFVNIFTVEMLTGAASKIQKHLESGIRIGTFHREEFVRVVVKDRYIFEIDTHLKEKEKKVKKKGGRLDLTNELIHFLSVQACFF